MEKLPFLFLRLLRSQNYNAKVVLDTFFSPFLLNGVAEYMLCDVDLLKIFLFIIMFVLLAACLNSNS